MPNRRAGAAADNYLFPPFKRRHRRSRMREGLNDDKGTCEAQVTTQV